MAIKPGRSSKLEAVIGFDDCGGSKNSPFGAPKSWIEFCSIEKGFFFEFYKRMTGKLGSEIITTTVPRQRRQKAC
jgi:hypothetical protein